MDVSAFTLVLVGGLISLVSTVSGIFISHWLEAKRESRQVKRYPTEVLYNKQTEFFDKVVTILDEVNGYITEIDVWLGEKGEEANERLTKAVDRNIPIGRLHDLLQQYYIYLPEKLVDDIDTLFFESLNLRNTPTHKQVQKCFDLLFALQNRIREVVGTDSLSRDLLQAFSTAGSSKKDK